jgi:purine-nucleoside phosphorylase
VTAQPEPSAARAATATGAAGVPLDVAVRDAWRALQARDVDLPQSLLLLGTGTGLLPERLAGARSLPLGDLPSAPCRWQGARLWSGALGGHRVWLLEDPAGEPAGAPDPRAGAWERAFPVWLAAVAGARLLVHASAGAAVAPGLAAGAFALASDHLNLSGGSPLFGLGESTLGPLFPDLSRLHHAPLRRAAVARARAAGVDVAEAVVACTAGPTVETPAERAFYARAGADVAVQGLAGPLLAAAHAGMVALAIVAVADAPAPGGAPTPLRDIVASAGRAEAALEDLLVALAPDLDAACAALEDPQ